MTAPQASLASAICALLPFVPAYVIAVPGFVSLASQGRWVPALAFAGAHLGSLWGDTLIYEEIEGGNPYLMSLGVLGGIYTFDNPLQVRWCSVGKGKNCLCRLSRSDCALLQSPCRAACWAPSWCPSSSSFRNFTASS